MNLGLDSTHLCYISNAFYNELPNSQIAFWLMGLLPQLEQLWARVQEQGQGQE